MLERAPCLGDPLFSSLLVMLMSLIIEVFHDVLRSGDCQLILNGLSIIGVLVSRCTVTIFSTLFTDFNTNEMKGGRIKNVFLR